jgi:ABC-type nitrate/sulfonate/bicarbonate transport system ATPase subunit/ABC-type nitrate/sulfonate/bicarbonate transport system permease component
VVPILSAETGLVRSELATPKIEIQGVTKQYHTNRIVQALERIDLRINEGEFVCLVGPSGCGKSTLLRMIAQLHRPTDGKIVIHTGGSGAVPTATVFQNYNVFPWKTVEANVRFGLEMSGAGRAETAERSRRWLTTMGLSEFAASYPSTLSGGMLQRVSIGRALAVEPEILLMDEPFAALDAQHRLLMQDELLALWQSNRRTVVFVTHSIDEAILLGDRIVVMSARPGRIVEEFRVPFERPRSADVRADPAFAALNQKIWGLLREEVERSYGHRDRSDVAAVVASSDHTSPDSTSRATGPATEISVEPGPAERDPGAYAKRVRLYERALSFATPIVFFAVWELAARLGWIPVRFFPSPSQIVVTATEMWRSGMLQRDLGASVLRILAGFSLGVAVGVGAGLALGLSRYLRAALDPFLSALYTVPKLAILPLFLLIFGLGETPNVLLVGLTVFFLVWITCMEAVISIPESYREAAGSFGARGWSMFRHVIWPAMLPQLFVAMRLAIGSAVLVVVGIEFVQADVGIGYRIWNSWSLFQADKMYVGICSVALLGVAFAVGVRAIGRLAAPWASQSGSGRSR